MNMRDKYPPEPYCDSDWRCNNPDHPRDERDDSECTLVLDDGTMQRNVDELAEKVVGHKIVSAVVEDVKTDSWWRHDKPLVLTLDTGDRVLLRNTDDCCASTELEAFLTHVGRVDHVITGVGTTDGFTKWHIYADYGDVLELTVGWSPGNPFYYGYGFDIEVLPL